ncbi:MAG: T9SS type A sorting domain-containing protein [Bacteroidia bacterium]|nr:T9SS type A sorting domain-containing protein [Bacteroidia bacterium]
MKNVHITLAIILCSATGLQAQTWTEVVTDRPDDGNNTALLDGSKLEFYHDEDADSLWFRFTTREITSTQEAELGINLMVNIPGGGTTFDFWGSQNQDAYHKLVTAWVTGSAPSNYTGTIGVANASGVSANNFTNLSSDNLTIVVDPDEKTIVIGMKREDLITDSEMSGSSTTMKIAGAVGSNMSWNDDLHSPTAEITVSGTAGVELIKQQDHVFRVFPNPANESVTIFQGETKPSRLTMVDVTGRIVAQHSLTDVSSTLDLREFENGVYSLIVQTEDGVVLTKQVVVNHN